VLGRAVDESYDVRGMVGHASHPEVLARAGAQDADMLIAVTRSDEVNIVACEVAQALFGVKRRIARLRHHGYLERIWSGRCAADQLPIDVVISPEAEVARGIVRRLRTPGAFDMVTLVDGKVRLLGIHCDQVPCPVAGTRLADLAGAFPHMAVNVLAIFRRGRAFVPRGQDRIEAGDDVYVVTAPDQVDELMGAFGHHERVARRVVIVGAGNVGLHLAQTLGHEAPLVSLKLIEHSKERAELVSTELGDGVVVLHGDALDKETLEEANIRSAETVVAVTNDDETNIFASVLAKREGCARAITLVNKASYEPLLPALGIDAVVSPNEVTISTILRHLRRGAISAVHTLRESFGEVIEAEALAGSRLVGGLLEDVVMPEGMRIGVVVRPDGTVRIPDGRFRIEAGDRVVAIVTYRALHKAEAMLTGREG
jgi:trk system potassium uptake protein TrkA